MEDNGLIVLEQKTVLAQFIGDDGLDPYVAEARKIVDGFEHDMSTPGSRKKTASLAAKVASLKVKLDEMGKDLVADWKKQSKAVDTTRKAMRDSLDLLKVEARKPLTEWEAEEDRKVAAQQEEFRLAEEKRIADEEAAKLRQQVENDHELALLLDEKIVREKKEAAQKLELERIAEQNRIESEAAEQAERNAQAELDQLQKEKDDAEAAQKRAEQEAKDAQERSKREAEQAEQRRLQDIENAKQQQIKEQQDREAAELAEQQRKDANTRNIGKKRSEAKEAIMALGFDEADAKKIVLAVAKGKIPNISIKY